MTLALLLIPYALVVLLFLLASVVFIYHLLRFGVANFSLAVIVLIYVIVSTTLLTTSFQSLSGVDWQQPLTLKTSQATESFFPHQ